jgi:hypothetical protein
MKKLIVLACVGIGLATVALADKPIKPTPTPAPVAEKGCQFPGTWFGIASPENPVLTGWVVSVTGQSNSHGTNNLEYPIFDPTLGIPALKDAVRISTLRGAWERTGGNTFIYSFMGFGVDKDNKAVWIGRVSGNITLSPDCSTEYITATMEVFAPNVSPFTGAPMFPPVELAPHYGQRMNVTLP